MTQYEFDVAISDALRSGDITKLAERRGKSVSLYAQMMSPNDERESNLYKAALDIRALIEISPERGTEVLRIVTDFISEVADGEADRAELAIEKAERELDEAKAVLERIRDRNDRRQRDEPVKKERRGTFDLLSAEILKKVHSRRDEQEPRSLAPKLAAVR